MRRAAAALAAAAFLALPEAASAHATLVRTEPANGAVLAQAPAAVRVTFDDAVRVGSGNEAVRDGGGSVLAGPPQVDRSRTLVLPLRRLVPGDYSVRWSIVSDDGHEEQGVLAFAFGSGRAPPPSTLHVQGQLGPANVLSRTLYFLGILIAVGAVVFEAGVRARPPFWLAFGGFVLAFLGESAILHSVSAGGTRFARVNEIGTLAALVGAAAAALAQTYPRARPAMWAAAGVLLVVPTLGGHALDPGRPRALSAAVDVVHVGAAASWLGGLAALALVLPRVRDPLAVARRFSALALVAVVALALTGGVRALLELSAVRQLWTTGYGRAIDVKTVLFAVLLTVGWLNRGRLARAQSVRRIVLVELALLLGVVVAVAVLTELRPGRQQARAAPAAAAPAPPLLPPPGGLVLGGRSGSDAVGLSVRRSGRRDELTATVIDPSGSGASVPVSFRVGGRSVPGRPCGSGCARAFVAGGNPGPIDVVLPGGAARFAIPETWPPPPAGAIERRASLAFRRARSLVIDERIASGLGPVQRSRLELVAPDRFAYFIVGGSQGIVIGPRRWDRQPNGTWVESAQTPLHQPTPYWSAGSRDARLLHRTPTTDIVSLLDPQIPAWFTIVIDRRTGRPSALRMTAAAHFMTDRYSRYDAAPAISPPR